MPKEGNKFRDLTGLKFGRWTVVSRGPTVNTKIRWNCVCECGKTGQVCTQNLKQGLSRSCGCYNYEIITRPHKHGMTDSSEFGIWQLMRDRCSNPRNSHWERYGGRGIRVCERWDEFSNFYADMGARPSRKHSIERIDNDGNYEPGNCRWATIKEQQRNKSTNRYIEAKGKRQILADWAKEIGISDSHLHYHLAHGKTIEQVMERFNG